MNKLPRREFLQLSKVFDADKHGPVGMAASEKLDRSSDQHFNVGDVKFSYREVSDGGTPKDATSVRQHQTA